jgi:TetR/AcrR family transcriptional regulator
LYSAERLIEHLADTGRIRRVGLRTFFFLLVHGAAAPFTLAPLARHFDTVDPLAPAQVESHADLAADLIIRALEIGTAARGGDRVSANGKRRQG